MIFTYLGGSLGASIGGAISRCMDASDEGEVIGNGGFTCGGLGFALDVIAGTALLTVGLLGFYHIIPIASYGYWSMIGIGAGMLALPGTAFAMMLVATVTICVEGIIILPIALPVGCCVAAYQRARG